ncbi:hypothetical protein [Pedobacter agri]|uniref:hypothetical protein n=1 Tax=Pedobacter agri TaxID=454586 RepID=UPI00292F469A|nr:hypothetical protein [Pedobacter agri]
MFLFAKSTIINYINNNPESRISLVLWLNNFETRSHSFFTDFDIDFHYPNGSGSSSFTDDYTIQYEINIHAKALLITWVGNKDELKEKQRIEQEEFERYNREVLGGKLISGTFSATGRGISRKPIKPDPSIPTFKSDLQKRIESFNIEINASELDHFKTVEDYECAVDEAISLFSSRPGSSSFKELLMLLFKIDHYQRNVLIFPEANLVELVSHMMSFFKLNISDFSDILSTTEFELFLSHQLKLKAYTLKRILTRMGLKFLYGKIKQ